VSLGKPVIIGDGTGSTYFAGVTSREALQIEGVSGGTGITVQGDVADDAPDSGAPVKVGGVGRTTNRTPVANGDRVNAAFDDMGRQFKVPVQLRDLHVHQQATITNSTAETTILAAGAAGVFHDVLAFVFANTDATKSTVVTIKDATAGTTRLVVVVAAYATVVVQLPTPLTQASAANNWTATCDTAVTSLQVTTVAVKNV